MAVVFPTTYPPSSSSSGICLSFQPSYLLCSTRGGCPIISIILAAPPPTRTRREQAGHNEESLLDFLKTSNNTQFGSRRNRIPSFVRSGPRASV